MWYGTGRFLRQQRSKVGLTPSWVARQLGVSRAEYREVEQGKSLLDYDKLKSWAVLVAYGKEAMRRTEIKLTEEQAIKATALMEGIRLHFKNDQGGTGDEPVEASEG